MTSAACSCRRTGRVPFDAVATASDLELRHLRTFAAVARRRSFTRAADDLHIAQQAVSQHLAELGFRQSRFELSVVTLDEEQFKSQLARPATNGLDTVEFQFAPNPGEPSRPLRANCGLMSQQCMLLDHLVGTGQKREWNGEPERVCSLEVDRQIELRRLLLNHLVRCGS